LLSGGKFNTRIFIHFEIGGRQACYIDDGCRHRWWFKKSDAGNISKNIWRNLHVFFLPFLPISSGWFFFNIYRIFALFRKDRIVALFLLLLIGVNAFFFISFGPGIERTTKYTFYISDYAVFSIFVGYGFFTFMNYVKNKGYSLTKIFSIGLALIILLPLLLYNITPHASKNLGIDLLHARTIPYRDNEKYFLNPSKRGYIGAARYAEEVFKTAKLESIIIADFTLCTVLEYSQQIKGARSDISVIDSKDNRRMPLTKWYPNTTEDGIST